MILIVDDNAENIFALKQILEYSNFEVDTALSGEEALKKIIRQTYALIILDVQMPGMDGFEVAEAISGYSKSKDTSIIFLSAVSVDKKFITRGYSSGGVDYITKPVDSDILLLKVKTFYKLYEQTKQLNDIHKALREEIDVRKIAQLELKERMQELRSILESIPQIAFTAKSDGTIEFVNQQWFQYANWDQEFPNAHPEDKNLQEEWRKLIIAGEPLTMEIRLKKTGQDEFKWHLLKSLPVKENDQIVKWVGTFTDIEEQKQAEQKKDEFMSIASHELKTPLTSIKAYMQLLERSVTNIEDGSIRQFVSRTQNQIEKLQKLIEDLLDVSKIESGKLQFNMHDFDFDQLLKSVIETVQQTHPNCTITQMGDARVRIVADEARIEQVISNFLSNAIKYSPDCQKVDVETVVADGQLTVMVKDYGIGIQKEKQLRIFEKFFRAEESANRFTGLGIGLYICAEIIRRHGGSFGVDSEPGKGSNFYFTIPVHS